MHMELTERLRAVGALDAISRTDDTQRLEWPVTFAAIAEQLARRIADSRVTAEKLGDEIGFGIEPILESPEALWDYSRACGLYFSIASRVALNSLPGFHSGNFAAFATLKPTRNSSCASSAAPMRSQSGFTSSEGAW